MEADPLPALDIEDVAAEGTVLVLDQITDPHNVGAILRSAAAFAVKAVITTARHSPEATGVLAKSASGALDLVPIVTVPNLARALAELKERGFLTVGLDSEGETSLSEASLSEPLALGARRRRPWLAPAHAANLRYPRAARSARRDQEPERVECRSRRALCGGRCSARQALNSKTAGFRPPHRSISILRRSGPPFRRAHVARRMHDARHPVHVHAMHVHGAACICSCCGTHRIAR